MTFEIINPESLGAPRGWSNGMLAPAGGRVLFVAGQAAADRDGHVATAGITEQWDRALKRILAIVEAAGGTAASIGRMTVFVTDMEDYRSNLKPIGEVHRKHMGKHYPAMALVAVRDLVDPNACIEIEATAVV